MGGISLRIGIALAAGLAQYLSEAPARGQAADAAESVPAADYLTPRQSPSDSADKPSGRLAPATVDDRSQAGSREVLGFQQARATAQMGELEERMYRLSEGLRELEPANASRLLVGLKLAREELIRLQMSQAEGLLADDRLAEANQQIKQIVAKLERLKALLTTGDLDFELQLSQLRQVRSLLGDLEAAIAEETREAEASRKTRRAEDEARRLRKRTIELDELIKRQAEHLREAGALAGDTVPESPSPGPTGGRDAGTDDPQREADPGQPPGDGQPPVSPPDPASTGAHAESPVPVERLAAAQQETLQMTRLLAAREEAQGQKPATLDEAAKAMSEAAAALAQRDAARAVPAQGRALKLLEGLQKHDAAERQRQEALLERSRYAAQQRDQAGNRRLAQRIAQGIAELGEGGASARQEALRAEGAMGQAEAALGRRQAAPANARQLESLASLRHAQGELSRLEEEILAVLGPQIRKRVIDALTALCERQTTIREATAALAAQPAERRRQSALAAGRLAADQEGLAAECEQLFALVEETRFAIALPAALKMIAREMTAVAQRLAAGEASEAVVSVQLRIEEDLAGLLEAMAKMPPPGRGGGRPGSGEDLQERERELNRLIAELRMLRLLQVRINDDTIDVDGRRGSPDELEAELAAVITRLEVDQRKLEETTGRLASERTGP